MKYVNKTLSFILHMDPIHIIFLFCWKPWLYLMCTSEKEMYNLTVKQVEPWVFHMCGIE